MALCDSNGCSCLCDSFFRNEDEDEDVKVWDVARVVNFAKQQGLDDAALNVLEVQQIDGAILGTISENDLKDAGMVLGPRRKLMQALKKLNIPREGVACPLCFGVVPSMTLIFACLCACDAVIQTPDDTTSHSSSCVVFVRCVLFSSLFCRVCSCC